MFIEDLKLFIGIRSKKKDSSYYLFEPKPDITAYEMAQIFAIGNIFFHNVSEELKRHFILVQKNTIEEAPKK